MNILLRLFAFVSEPSHICSDETFKGLKPTLFFLQSGIFAHSKEIKEAAVLYPRSYAVIAYGSPLKVLSAGQGVPLFVAPINLFLNLSFYENDKTVKDSKPVNQVDRLFPLAGLPMLTNASRRNIPPAQAQPLPGSVPNSLTKSRLNFIPFPVGAYQWRINPIIKLFKSNNMNISDISLEQARPLLEQLDSIISSDHLEGIEKDLQDIIISYCYHYERDGGKGLGGKIFLLFNLMEVLRTSHKLLESPFRRDRNTI